MAIDPEQLLRAQLPHVEQRYDWRDCVMYALGLGVGLDPLDEADLPFVDETRLAVEPAMATVLGYPGFWLRDLPLGLDWVKSVHGEQSMRLYLARRRRQRDVSHDRPGARRSRPRQRAFRGRGVMTNRILSDTSLLDANMRDTLRDPTNRKVTGKVVLTTGMRLWPKY